MSSKSFMLSTVASIGVVFAIGAIAVWGPYYVYLGQLMQEENANQTLDQYGICLDLQMSFIFFLSLNLICFSFFFKDLVDLWNRHHRFGSHGRCGGLLHGPKAPRQDPLCW